ncbi:hypothetical protein GWI33_020219 [Rhynchophorus ferrugineus]|uniref:Protein lava lamp-like n=1 Tax=Rhynchophorus ferrugineus TaxID=354439 RepID=A0A834HSU9_RHYFE|nr:hypothetical protein GWI33_020219 [Rhynchophorus ferrugineus]
MWDDPDPDPGGQKNVRPSAQELNDLGEETQKQLVLAQLKEMLRKEQSTVPQEKVEEYVNTLNKVKAKRSKQSKNEAGSTTKATTSSANIDAIKKERINFLRQQFEENKARLAERGKREKGIEEMISQIQAQLKDPPSLISSTPLNMPAQGSATFDFNENTPQKDLYNILITKEKKITELHDKSKRLEGTILDLQENLKEKDSVIDAKTKAITLMTDNLTNKRKTTLDTLEDTKEQMRKMQENFISLENEMKNRQLTLLNDLKMKNFEISDLKEKITILENEKLELGIVDVTDRISNEKNNDLELKALQTSFKEIEAENKKLLEKINELETLNNEDYLRKNQENENNLLKISELERQLKQLEGINQNILKDKIEIENKIFSEQDLASENTKLTEENLKNVSKIAELNKKLEETLFDLNVLKSTGMGANRHSDLDENEVTKLKKQLDESNKNMIKMRAMQKGKIKELNRKLDQFRKMSDANLLVGQLQNDITKLNEKIAELEEEKGNMQLKMIESTGDSKDNFNDLEEHIKDLNQKLSETTQMLGNKCDENKVLESEIDSLKAELKQKNEEQVKVSTHVSSEMSFIQYEEQIEKLEADIKHLEDLLKQSKVENEDLLDKIETIKKEKQDILLKLDSYIQENMDLIDKLEKLSAEKVSSVESIEIVEGLTQQEKLELAAYQKNLNPEEAEKSPEDESIEAPVELNESVLQLNEDTSELLQKIEMFTQERKEVMQKMESLKDDNELLHLKLKELENNKDLLEETYEQLQNEKENLISEKEQLLHQLEHVSNEKSTEDNSASAELLENKLKELQDQYESLLNENAELVKKIAEFNSEVPDKIELEKKLQYTTETNTTLQEQITNSNAEIKDLKVIIEDNKNNLIDLSSKVNKYQLIIADKEREIEELNKNLHYLNNVISDLHVKNKNYENMESELQLLNATINDQINSAMEYERSVSANSDVIQNLNKELADLNQKIIETEDDLKIQRSENIELKKDLTNKEETLKTIQEALADRDKKFKMINEEMKTKYYSLEQQLEANANSFKQQVDELLGKNKDHMDKMKKLAANLKKKSQANQELEQKYNSDKAEWEAKMQQTIQMSDDKIAGLTKDMKELENQLRIKLEENTAVKNEIDLLKNHILDLEQTNSDNQNYIFELKQRQEKISQVSLQQELSQSLHEDIDNSFSQNVTEDKIRELEMLLETKESEIYHYQQRIGKLEDNIRMLQEEKSMLETRNNDLLAELNVVSTTCNEKTLLENKYSEQLKGLEKLSKQLEESNEKLQESLKKNNENEDIIKRLKIKLKKSHDKITELKSQQINVQDLEQLNEKLKSQVSVLEAHQKQVENENETLYKKNLSDYEKIEADYQAQLEELLNLKNELSVENQKLIEQINELKSREQELNVVLEECKTKILQDEANYSEFINELQQQLKDQKETLDTSQSHGNRLQLELNEANTKLENSFMQIEDLNKVLTSLQNELTDLNKVKTNIDLLRQEKDHLNAQLQELNDKLSTALTEKESLEKQLSLRNEELTALHIDNDKLKGDVQALEFAKFSLEASCESAHKEDVEKPVVLEEFVVKTIKSNDAPIKQFSWADQNQPPVMASSLFDNLSETDSPFAEIKAPVMASNLFGNLSTADSPFDNLTYTVSESPIKVENHELIENPQQSNTSSTDVNYDGNNQFSPVIENSREALLQKVKALEFLLFNVDKEKEIALEQCINMVNELSRLICQAPNASQAEKPPVIDESQILSEVEVESLKSDKKAMKDLEYSPSKVDNSKHVLPVEEEVIQPKSAYLCFDDDEELNINKTKGGLLTEPQAIYEQGVASSAVNINQQYQPVEPLVQPKQASACYTKEEKPANLDAFEENDDGWGWGPEEAKLDEAYINTIENIPQIKALMLETQQLKDHIKVLQIERENHLEEIKQLQVKSGKLIKKCKELKQRSEQSTANKKLDDGGFFDLNETIQEELKSQIQGLEKKIKEVAQELEKEKAEKANILKKIDVLTSANDRMVEMKEIQDTEVLRWQRKYKEIEEKLQEYEWNNDGFQNERKESTSNIQQPTSEAQVPATEEHPDHLNKIQELENTIKELSLDNDELQALLEEQTNRRIQVEKNKGSNNSEIEELKRLNETLNANLDGEKLKLSEAQFELQSIKENNQKLNEELSSIKMVLKSKEHDDKTNDLQTELMSLKNNLESQVTLLEEKNTVIANLNNQLELYKTEINQSAQRFDSDAVAKSQEIESLKLCMSESTQNIENLQSQITQLNNTIGEKDQTISQLNNLIDNLNSEKLLLENQISENINTKSEELQKLLLEKDSILKELHDKNLQLEDVRKTVVELEQKVKDMEIIGSEETGKLQERCNELQQKEHDLIAEKAKLIDDVNIKSKQIEELTMENNNRDQQIQQLSVALENKDTEFAEKTNIMINELNESWQIQVDQRGTDVAESWKSHLDMVEKDYAVMQESLNAKISELEDKYNLISTENNELKNNIHKEVISEADAPIKVETQQAIDSLKLVIQENEKQIEDLQNKLSYYATVQNEIDTVKRQNSEKDSKIESMAVIIDTTQRQFDEKREVVEEIVALLEKNTSTPISYEKADILVECQRQINLGSEKDVEIEKLVQNISTLEANINRTIGEKDRQITGLNQVIEDLEKELSVIHEKDSEIIKLSTDLNVIQREKTNLEGQIKIIEEEQSNQFQKLEKLSHEHSNCCEAIENYKGKIDEYESRCSLLQIKIDEKERIINDLNEQLLQIQESAKNDSNKEVQSLTNEITKTKEEYLLLQKNANEYQTQITEITQKLTDRSHELELAQQNIQYYQYNFQTYEDEINNLRKTLEQREQEYTNSLELLKNNQLADIQRHYDELLSNKDLDNQMLQAQIQELLNANKEYNERISQEISSKQELEQKLLEQTHIVDEDTKQLEELKLIIEDQVAKIDELNKELFAKSSQYDSLVAEMDLSRQPVTQQPLSVVSQAVNASSSRSHYEDDLAEPVSRAELDLALYMLHQRDVRCEELTVELTQLLEERDTLQLKLSNVIREKEELRKILKDNSSSSSPGAAGATGSTASKIFLAASGTELAKDPLEMDDGLESKLSQLKNISYKKDKTFVDDQAVRRLQQIAIMEQHINEASKLPPEAAAKLVDASYTLSRDVQSPSKVLLNWLWGKSPPKANDS